jgi:hypothetical protein
MAYLPGQVLKPTAGASCEKHPDRPAPYRVVGETDSFGSEFIEMCQVCYDEFQAYTNDENNRQDCESCGKQKSASPRRDPSEGSSGPVYYWCAKCYKGVLDDFIGEDLLSKDDPYPYSIHDDDYFDDVDDGVFLGDGILTTESSIRDLNELIEFLHQTQYDFGFVQSDGSSKRGLTRHIRRAMAKQSNPLRIEVHASNVDLDEFFKRRIACEKLGSRVQIERKENTNPVIVFDFSISTGAVRKKVLEEIRALLDVAYELSSPLLSLNDWKVGNKGIVRA